MAFLNIHFFLFFSFHLGCNFIQVLYNTSSVYKGEATCHVANIKAARITKSEEYKTGQMKKNVQVPTEITIEQIKVN